ncbi:signal recognition particle-docking protein FtsY, partial [Candidatus Woesearchaeota archaeon]|nr:signal recognition particle-docking protein FtsY [Candidatus Woesearchaeota archaeon]
ASIKEKITTTRISGEKFHELFWDMEVLLLENNVALEVIEKIKADLEGELVDKPLPRAKVAAAVKSALGRSVMGLFDAEPVDLVVSAGKKKPFVILFVGINGSGKTTTIAKVARLLMGRKLKVVLAASDTFRAASIEQLQQHADKLGIKLVKHDYGSDPAAVAFDAIKYAEAHGTDAVLIDTAGRLHSNSNLMDEMKKIVRVSKPDMKVFVGEAITGNDCVNQAREFNNAVGIDAIILAKADVDEKGGAAVSVSYVTKKPIIYMGTGQGYDDLKEFEPRMVVEGLGLE